MGFSDRSDRGTMPPLAAVVVAIGVAVWAGACGSPPDDGGGGDEPAQAAVVPASGGAAAAAAAAEPGGEAAPAVPGTDRRTPTSDWTDRRALEAADAVFPHSAHREQPCQRCHVRPAGHVTHSGAACTACHARPAVFADMPTLSSEQCAACHHRAGTGRPCTACHRTESLGPSPVLASVTTAGGKHVRVHRLTFAHERHVQLGCTRCHTGTVTRKFADDCSLCHTDHHRPEAACTSCHDAGQIETHDNSVHGGCAGGDCHDAATVRDLKPTRNVCLTCHTAQMQHEPGQECRSCHVGLLETPGATRGGGR